MSKSYPGVLAPPPTPPAVAARRWVARSLRRASGGFVRLARVLHVREAVTDPVAPLLEFHAEAGAPEGALFVDGVRVGTLEGVRRL